MATNLKKQAESTLGKRLLDRFGVKESIHTLDLGGGDVIEFKVPKTYREYSTALEAANEKYKESGSEDANDLYVLILEEFVQNLNPLEIRDIVYNAPQLTETMLKLIDSLSGNLQFRLEAEAILASKKKSKKTQGGQTSSDAA